MWWEATKRLEDDRLAGVLVLGVSGPVVAGFDEGLAAYERGDYETAYKEFLPLAQTGDAGAQTILGFMYNVGLALPQDYVRAHMWWSLAAAQGNEIAVKNRDIVAGRMSPADISKAQKIAREWKPKK